MEPNMLPSDKLTPHFVLAEVIASSTADQYGLENYPESEIHMRNIQYTAECMELVRKVLGNNPIKINSWYRSPAVNRKVGGVPNSQHAQGQAVDFTCAKFGTIQQVCKKLMESKGVINYDQLILEPTWVHISFTTGKPRLAELTYHNGGTYSRGILV